MLCWQLFIIDCIIPDDGFFPDTDLFSCSVSEWRSSITWVRIVFMGEISYVTKALSAVLQLGVTMDYSIFLWHSYEDQKKIYENDHKNAMAHAISQTVTSVVGSSITTVAGFIALCFMGFTWVKILESLWQKAWYLALLDV